MINTYNESKLHRTVKNIYALECDGKTEVKVGSFICDIVTNDEIIEIQTASVSRLKQKIASLIDTYRIRIIFPIAQNTVIETRNQNGDVLSVRKSPKHETIFRLYREVTGLTPFFDIEGFSITVLFVTQKVIRVKTEEPVQTPNKSRRFKRNWLIIDKELMSINGEQTFCSTRDYRAPIESALKEVTQTADNSIKTKLCPQNTADFAPKADVSQNTADFAKTVAVSGKTATQPKTVAPENITPKRTNRKRSVAETQTSSAAPLQIKEAVIPYTVAYTPKAADGDTTAFAPKVAASAKADFAPKAAAQPSKTAPTDAPLAKSASAKKTAAPAKAATKDGVNTKDCFTVKDLKNAGAGKYAPFAIWLLKKVSCIEEQPRIGREKRYRFTDDSE